MSYETLGGYDTLDPTGLVATLHADTAAMTAAATATPPRRTRRRPSRRTVAIGCVLAGLIIIGLAAAALSFASIAGLAVQCGVPPELAWLLPIVIDAGVVVGTIVWLSRRLFPNEDARVLAACYTVALLVVSVAANVTNHVLTVRREDPDIIVIGMVSALAPITIGLVVHLAVTALRPARLAAPGPVREDSADTGAEDSHPHADTDTGADTDGGDADMDSGADADGYSTRIRADAAAAGLDLPPAPPGETRADRRKRIGRERKRVRRAVDTLRAMADARTGAPDVLAGG